MKKSNVPKIIGNYSLKKQIGKGSFATVWLAEHTLAKENVAIKIIDNTTIQEEEARTRFIREINIMKQTDHPFISKLFEIIETPKYTYLVMEYAENGSILTYVNSHGRLPEKVVRRYFSQLISALEYLHEVRLIAHRDLKAENVLLDRNYNLRLIDFGLSNSFSADSPELKTACGSPAYAPPEMILGHKYTKAADIWSAGILLYAMVTGELPFDDDDIQRLLQQIAFTEPHYPNYLSPQIVDLLHKILTKNPETRLTIEKIKHHPWFSTNEYEMFSRLQSNEEKWLQSGIETDLIPKIQSMGVNINKLTQSLLEGEYNESTAIYLILKRIKVTESIKEMMDSLDESSRNKVEKPVARCNSGLNVGEQRRSHRLHMRPRHDSARIQAVPSPIAKQAAEQTPVSNQTNVVVVHEKRPSNQSERHNPIPRPIPKPAAHRRTNGNGDEQGPSPLKSLRKYNESKEVIKRRRSNSLVM
ncbi:CAMK family protein kinase [Histomonas meleagridis]|uniref:CAMK family protein kinase n=1 Tax=Histomonas meleagridis TaxID=135588 RepID=UPI0035593CD5|nr:CAMK family protein kinase [Histomonas meleagridis]KAH0799574.1 CAMK family protein kinase [Histomonas meleagridis]